MPKILDSWQDWECPECHKTDQTRPLPGNASRMHRCPVLKGIVAPLVRKGVRSRLVAVVREDYVGNEVVTLNSDKKPIMAVRVERDSGFDVAVFAPVARLAAQV